MCVKRERERESQRQTERERERERERESCFSKAIKGALKWFGLSVKTVRKSGEGLS